MAQRHAVGAKPESIAQRFDGMGARRIECGECTDVCNRWNDVPLLCLAPDLTADGSLKLTAIHHKLLAGILVGLMLAIGVVFWRNSWLSKWTAIATVAGVLMLLGVQTPIFARQVLNTPFYLGCGIVGLLWSVNALQGYGSRWQILRRA